MPRALIVLIVVILVLIGLLFVLSRQAGEVPTKTIEVEVNQPANAH